MLKPKVLSFFRQLAIVTGALWQWVYFKRKVYYVNGQTKQNAFGRGALVISNHFGVRDYISNLFMVAPRKLNVVASEDAYRNRFQSWGMQFFGGIEADRVSKSMSFIDQSVMALRHNQLVQIFPEAHNTPDGNVQPLKTSYLMIAHRADADLLPVVLDGHYGFTKRLHVLVGHRIPIRDLLPSDFPSKEEIIAANDKVFALLCAMKTELERKAAR